MITIECDKEELDSLMMRVLDYIDEIARQNLSLSVINATAAMGDLSSFIQRHIKEDAE